MLQVTTSLITKYIYENRNGGGTAKDSPTESLQNAILWINFSKNLNCKLFEYLLKNTIPQCWEF